MTITEVKAKKAEAERKIAAILSDLSDTTGCDVDDISLIHVDESTSLVKIDISL